MGVENEWRLGRRGRGWRGERGGGEEGRCHKEGGARETSATCVGDGDGGGGEGVAVTVAVRRRGRMIPVREEEVKGETRC